ncbi:hypothetical protein AB205_0210020 [Aquarana catesbeiana]|uniref:Uncharacterized protein n=1 Tax=Aquarana catesbeiana TaxID=8400 RepID=A0A2G9SBS2_AQUCT|nr:hypothetical protein AB205_0210020 [Aquarana catesbeiana]
MDLAAGLYFIPPAFFIEAAGSENDFNSIMMPIYSLSSRQVDQEVSKQPCCHWISSLNILLYSSQWGSTSAKEVFITTGYNH